MKSGRQQSQENPLTGRLNQSRVFGLVRSMLFAIALIGLAIWLSRLSSGTRVSSITPTRSLDSSFRPLEPTNIFQPDSTFFVSIKLEAYQPDKPVVARWKYEGHVINETTLSTEDLGDGYAGFSLSNSIEEWPVGGYYVEIMSNGLSLGGAAFEVIEAP